MLDPGEGLLRPDVDVFVVVSVRLYRDGIADALRRDPRFRVAGSAASLEDAEAHLRVLARPPDVMLVDLDLPEGAVVARLLHAGWPGTRVTKTAVARYRTRCAADVPAFP